MKVTLSYEESKERSMKIPVPVVLAIAALSIAALSCVGIDDGDSPSANMETSASPATFKSVGEVITLTYSVRAHDYIDFTDSYKVTDKAADTTPSCPRPPGNKNDWLVCKATHTITTEDVALGYVISSAEFTGFIAEQTVLLLPGPYKPLYEKATTVVYIENFIPSPTPTITPTLTATPVFTATPSETGQEIIIPQPNILILQPVLAGSVSTCDTGLGFINFPLADPLPDLTDKNLEVIINGYKVNCTIAGSRNQLLSCSLPTDMTFPLRVGTTVDSVQVDSFSFSGATCTNTMPTKERDPNDPDTPVVPPIPVDCVADPYNPACP